ncbi:FlgD immunoglobulin-like domain containing protein [Baekduia soli]|uniref:FlgD immunoglobulin-like domain containing protein n=1 Tax=Baekduia soli TaxID=496014 RepID=UPI00165230AA|nr:FlgD immunoglobulin-like domain containing protein [Baekduia soli]
MSPVGARPRPTTVVVLFGILVAATFAAFFVAQRLKNAPSVIQSLRINSAGPGNVFSPNGDGRRERVRIALKLKKADRVTLAVLDARGDVVRTLVDDRPVRAYETIGLPGVPWDGRDDAGRVVPDGRYRLRITLRNQGRSVVVPRSILKDTKPPTPLVTAIGPETAYGPELLPEAGDRPAQIHFGPALAFARLHIFRTAPGTIRVVRTADLKPGAREFDWDGTDDTGRRVSPGTYLAVPEWRDVAGNIGTSVPLDKAGLPVLGHGRLRGRGGITVRYLGARPPVTPALARDRVTIDVDSRRQRYTWEVRRVGGTAVKRSGAPKTRPRVVFAAPGGTSGAYVFQARTRTHTTRVVFAVQARRSVAGTAARPRGVLVVLPVITWQGLNPVDDDGDGAPNTLALGVPSRPFRVMGGGGLPAGFTDREAPILRWLDRTGRRYDVTTDLALMLGRGPRLTGHHGVLIPGDARWLPSRVRTNLRTFAREGGTVVSAGIDSLRRTVRIDDNGRLADPSAERATDLFGARLRPLVQHTSDLENFQDDADVSLFSGGDGLFGAVPSWEPTMSAGPDADLVARAVTVDPAGFNVIVAVRFGKGLVIRPGFPAFAPRLSTNDPAVTALMARMWTLLSR